MRIVTRPDFDGVVCAVLLYEALDINEPVFWVEPNDLQKGRVEIRDGDVIANLPFHENCQLWFDHHYTNRTDQSFEGAFKIAPSAAGIVFEYFKDRFDRDYSELVRATDKIDAADLTLDEVLHPENNDYILLSMTILNGDEPELSYWNRLVDLLRKNEIQKVLADPQVKQRCLAVVDQNEKYHEYLKANTRLERHVSITDFRGLNKTPVGNRFLVYSLYPESTVHMRIRFEDQRKQMVVINVGHSIFNRHCNVNIGLILAEFGGGGHRGAGSTRFPASKADDYISRIIDILLKNENNEI